MQANQVVTSTRITRRASVAGVTAAANTARPDPTTPRPDPTARPDPTTPHLDRAVACLEGLALGDALGMPTQTLSPDDIHRTYAGLHALVDATPDQPIAPGMAAGSVTDDTEQAFLLAGLLITGNGHIDPRALADALITWEDSMRARGSLDLLGPSTLRAVEQLRAGAPIGTTGTTGTTNGAAMRVAPVGIAVPLDDPGALLDVVHESCILSHDTVQGVESAALVAATVSAGIGGASPREAVEHALALVGEARPRGHWSPHPRVLTRARSAIDGSRALAGPDLVRFLREEVGTSLESGESVPAALTLAWHGGRDPFGTLLVAATLGGDTDTIAAIAGACLGASLGTTAFPADQVALVRRVNDLPVESTAAALLRLRGRSRPAHGGPLDEGVRARGEEA